jgi:protein-tyrosine phosphatase
MHYHHILPYLLVGSHPASTEDIDELKDDVGVTAVLNLQTDDDFESLRIDGDRLHAFYESRGMQVRRVPVRDYDDDDLRRHLPRCVRVLSGLVDQDHIVYVHCTAGAGRSPSAVIAYLCWCQDWDLDDAVPYVKARHPCSPDVEAIRLASEDRAR